MYPSHVTSLLTQARSYGSASHVSGTKKIAGEILIAIDFLNAVTFLSSLLTNV